MRTLELTFVLPFVWFTFTEAVDPAKFQCRKNSPTGGDIFSDDYPPVNLVHIFCVRINSYGQAIGFLQLPIRYWSNMYKDRIIHTGTIIKRNWQLYILVQLSREISIEFQWPCKSQHNVQEWAQISALLLQDFSLEWVKWVPKEYDTTFWPTYMTIAHVVSTIQKLYNSFASGQEGKICIRKYFDPSYHEKFDVIIIVQYGEVTTAYPGNCSKMAQAQIYKYDHNYYQRRHSELRPIH